jgi:hypothetical protein
MATSERLFHENVDIVRNRIKEINFSGKLIDDRGLLGFLRHHFRLTSLDLNGCPNITFADLALAEALQKLPHLTSLNLQDCKGITNVGLMDLARGLAGKPLKKLNVSGCNFGNQLNGQMNTCWITLFNALNPRELEEFDCSRLGCQSATTAFYESLFAKLATCERLQRFGYSMGGDLQKRLLRTLHPTLQHLNFPSLYLNAEQTTVMRTRFLPANIKSCDLRFSLLEDEPVREQTAEACLRWLPLARMNKIRLRNINPTPLNIHLLAQGLEQNQDLEELMIEPHPDLSTSAVIHLIRSIASRNLRVLKMPLPFVPDYTFINQTILNYQLLQLLSIAPQLKSIEITKDFSSRTDFLRNMPTLSHARVLFTLRDELLDGDPVSHRDLRLQPIEVALRVLENTTEREIANHYVNLFAAVLNHRIPNFRQFITELNPAPIENLSKLDYIRFLENLFAGEMDRLDAEDAAAPVEGDPVQLLEDPIAQRQNRYQAALNILHTQASSRNRPPQEEKKADE